MLFGFPHLLRRAARPTTGSVLEPGSTVVLHTDGLIESRRSDLDQGTDALRALLTRHHGLARPGAGRHRGDVHGRRPARRRRRRDGRPAELTEPASGGGPEWRHAPPTDRHAPRQVRLAGRGGRPRAAAGRAGPAGGGAGRAVAARAGRRPRPGRVLVGHPRPADLEAGGQAARHRRPSCGSTTGSTGRPTGSWWAWSGSCRTPPARCCSSGTTRASRTWSPS